MPLDVRKLYDLPTFGKSLWGYAPTWGRSPGCNDYEIGGAEPPPHIRRQAAEPL
jgi:hypothetical protein